MSVYSRSVVATGHELVSSAAASILEAGGNAFDAVVSAGFAGAVAEQTLTSLGGGGFLLARTGGTKEPIKEVFYDFFVDNPGLGLQVQPEPHFFPVTVNFGGSNQDFNIGCASVAVPGTLKGLLHIHQQLGRMPLREVLYPAIELAKGHELNNFQASFLRLLHPIVTLSETGREIYEPDGNFLESGDLLVNRQMVDFLLETANDGGDNFYRGDIAHSIDREMRENGGLLTFEDLCNYKVIQRKPFEVFYRGYQLLTGPAPTQGGALIGLSLALLEKFESFGKWGSSEHLLRTAALMQQVESLREQGIYSPDALEKYHESGEIENSVQGIRMFSRGTTHISIADKDGNIASMTCSNGEGSGYFAPGTGIMLNNMMGEDDLHPEGFHLSPAGSRVASMMSPSALIKDGEVKLVLGSGGSKRIRTAITQVLTQFIDFKRDLNIAVNAPRMHWDGSTVQMEPGFPSESLKDLSAKLPINIWDERSVYFGGVHSVIPGIDGVGDPRRGGSVMVIQS